MNDDNTDAFTTSLAVTSGGRHGGASSGLYWEATLFWHWEGPSYHDPKNPYEPEATIRFAGHADGTFFDPTGQSDLKSNLIGGGRDNYFEWGDPTSGFSKGSNITFTGKSFKDVGVGDLFELGNMKFQNNTIWDGTDAYTVKFDLDLGLETPELTGSLGFSFDLYSTKNSSENTDDENADYFTFGNFSADFATEIEGQLYGLSLRFGEVNNNGFSTIDEFHTHEGKTAQGTLYGSFYAVDSADLADYFIP